MKTEQDIHPFIRYLYSLAESDNRGALADLRRGNNGQPGTVPATFQYVAPWVPDNERNSWREKVYYIIAALFAQYQAGSSGKRLMTNQGNFGALAALKAQKTQSGSLKPLFELTKANRMIATFLRSCWFVAR